MNELHRPLLRPLLSVCGPPCGAEVYHARACDRRSTSCAQGSRRSESVHQTKSFISASLPVDETADPLRRVRSEARGSFGTVRYGCTALQMVEIAVSGASKRGTRRRAYLSRYETSIIGMASRRMRAVSVRSVWCQQRLENARSACAHGWWRRIRTTLRRARPCGSYLCVPGQGGLVRSYAVGSACTADVPNDEEHLHKQNAPEDLPDVVMQREWPVDLVAQAAVIDEEEGREQARRGELQSRACGHDMSTGAELRFASVAGCEDLQHRNERSMRLPIGFLRCTHAACSLDRDGGDLDGKDCPAEAVRTPRQEHQPRARIARHNSGRTLSDLVTA